MFIVRSAASVVQALDRDRWYLDALPLSQVTILRGRLLAGLIGAAPGCLAIGAATMRFLESAVVEDLGEISLEDPDDDLELGISLDALPPRRERS